MKFKIMPLLTMFRCWTCLAHIPLVAWKVLSVVAFSYNKIKMNMNQWIHFQSANNQFPKI